MIKYLGSKRLLLPHLEAAFAALPGAERVLDLFSGTARVGRALKAAGHEVIANDAMSYAATLARCYVEADPRCLPDVERALAELAAVPPRAGYFTRTFCEEARRFEEKRRETNIRVGNPDDPITSLSGGNQQKVVFSRWFGLESEVFILDNPTQGIDVGAKFEIYQLINRIVETGKSVIMFSSEFPEIYKIADRCIVMYKGEINHVFDRDQLNEVDVMYYATGSNRKAG